MAFTHHDTINVLSQNVLLDKTRTANGLILPQDDRIASIAATLGAFDGELSIVGAQEIFKSTQQHNGEVLADSLGVGPGHWVEHNQRTELSAKANKGRAGEYVGVFGERVTAAKAIELGDNRRGVLSEIGGVAFLLIHVRSGHNNAARLLRKQQQTEVVRALEEYEDAVVFGDFNEPPIRFIAAGRDVLAKNGFTSVFALTNQPSPKTFPADGYEKLRSVPRPMSLDDIVVRGDRIRVLAAGVLDQVVSTTERPDGYDNAPLEPSDHVGIWATLDIAQM